MHGARYINVRRLYRVPLQRGPAIYRLAPKSTKFCHNYSLANNHSAVAIRRADERKPRLAQTNLPFEMKSVPLIIIAFVVLLLAGGMAFLAMWEIPAPSAPVHKVLPDDRFPR